MIWSYISSGQVAYYLGDYSAAETIWAKLQPLVVGVTSFMTHTLVVFFECLIATAAYLETGKGVYMRRARNATKAMNVNMKKFNTGLNNLHRFYIMDAVCFSTFQRKVSMDRARKRFDQAITAAQRSGFLQDAAVVLLHLLLGGVKHS